VNPAINGWAIFKDKCRSAGGRSQEP